jgi:hypothetical protein
MDMQSDPLVIQADDAGLEHDLSSENRYPLFRIMPQRCQTSYQPSRQSFQCQVLRFDAGGDAFEYAPLPSLVHYWHSARVTKFSVLQSPGWRL